MLILKKKISKMASPACETVRKHSKRRERTSSDCQGRTSIGKDAVHEMFALKLSVLTECLSKYGPTSSLLGNCNMMKCDENQQKHDPPGFGHVNFSKEVHPQHKKKGSLWPLCLTSSFLGHLRFKCFKIPSDARLLDELLI